MDGDEDEDEDDGETGLIDDPEIAERIARFEELINEFGSSPAAMQSLRGLNCEPDSMTAMFLFGLESVSRNFDFTNETDAPQLA